MDHSDHHKPLYLQPVIPVVFVLKAERNRCMTFLNSIGENEVASWGSLEHSRAQN